MCDGEEAQAETAATLRPTKCLPRPGEPPATFHSPPPVPVGFGVFCACRISPIARGWVEMDRQDIRGVLSVMAKEGVGQSASWRSTPGHVAILKMGQCHSEA